MGDVDWNALAAEVGAAPIPPKAPPKPPIDGMQGVDPELLRRINELNAILPPGAKFQLNLPAGGSAPSPMGQGQTSEAQNVALPPAQAAGGLLPLPAAPASGPVDWNALAAEVGMPPIPTAIPPNSTPPAPAPAPGSTIAPPLGAPDVSQLMRPTGLREGLERLKLPEFFTLAGTRPGEEPSQHAEDLAARGIPSMSALPPEQSFLDRVGGALHDYLTEQMRSDAGPASRAALEDAKRRLGQEVVQVFRAGGTAWNNLVHMAQQVPEAGEAIKEAVGGLLGGMGASAAGALGVPGATPDVVKDELLRSRAGAEKVVGTGLGLAQGFTDPWMYAATDQKKFKEMIDADPINTALMMLPGLHVAAGLRPGAALKSGLVKAIPDIRTGTQFELGRYSLRETEALRDLGLIREQTSSPIAKGEPAEGTWVWENPDVTVGKARLEAGKAARENIAAGIRATEPEVKTVQAQKVEPEVKTVRAERVERRPTPEGEGPRRDWNAILSEAEAEPDFAKKKAIMGEFDRQYFREMADRGGGDIERAARIAQMDERMRGIANRREDIWSKIAANEPRPTAIPRGERAEVDLAASVKPLDMTSLSPEALEQLRGHLQKAFDDRQAAGKPEPNSLLRDNIAAVNAEIARRSSTPAQQAGQPGETKAGAGVEEPPADRATAPAPNFTLVSHQEFPNGKSLTYWKADRDITIGDQVYPAGRSLTAGEIERAGFKAPKREAPPTVTSTNSQEISPKESVSSKKTTVSTETAVPEKSEHAIGESLRYGKQRVEVKEVLRDGEGNIQGYRVKAKGDKPFVIKAEDAKPWGERKTTGPPPMEPVRHLEPEDLGNTEIVLRWIKNEGGLKLDGESRNLRETIAAEGSGLQHLASVVHKDGLSTDALAEALAGEAGLFPDREAAKEWLDEWVKDQGRDTMGPEEGRLVDRAKSQGERFGVEVPERKARLTFAGRDTEKLVLNPEKGQKGSLKVRDVVVTRDDVYRVKKDPQSPGKLMLKDGDTIRLKEGETVTGRKVGKMPKRTLEELKAAGRPVPEELRRKEATSLEEPAIPEQHADLVGKMKDWLEIDQHAQAPPNPKDKAYMRFLDDQRREQDSIETALDDIGQKEGPEVEQALRKAAEWPDKSPDVLEGARRRTREAADKMERLRKQDEQRAKDVKKGQRSLTDQETTREVDEEAAAREGKARFDKGQGGMFDEEGDGGETPFYPNPTEGVETAARRPVPLEKNLKPRRREAVARAQDIKRRLERAVLAPIRHGLGRMKARGVFKVVQRVIRTRKYLDLPVDFHEAGHALRDILFPDYAYKPRGKGQPKNAMAFNIKGPNSRAMRAELVQLGKDLYGTRKPPTGYRDEGLAEFVKFYVTDRAKAQAKAPSFYAEFQKRLLQDADTIDIGRVLDESAEAYRQWREQPAVAKALANMSIGEGAWRPWTLDRISSALFNNQAFIRAVTKRLNGGVVPEEGLGNPITHAKLLRGWTGLAEVALSRGGGVANISGAVAFARKFKSVYDILKDNNVGDSPLPFVSEAVRAYDKLSPHERLLRRMTNVFQDAENMRGLDTLRAYWYAERTISIAEGDAARAYAKRANVSDKVALDYVRKKYENAHEGLTGHRETGLTYAEARQIRKDLETPGLKNAVKELTEYSNHTLHWLVEEGMWTEKQYRRVVDHPANLVYMPLDRWFSEYGERGGEGFQGRSISGARPDVGRLKGSDAPIIDPFETTIANTFHLAQTVMRNRAMRSLVEFAAERPGSGWASEAIPTPIVAQKFRLAEIQPLVDDLVKKAGGDPALLQPEDYDTWARVFRPAMKARAGRNIATYFKDGKEMQSEMSAEAYRAVAGLDQEALNSFIKIFGAPARWTRAGATLTPEFILRNTIRDPITASVLSETGGINPFSGAVPGITTFRGMRESIRNGDMAFRYRASGAAHAAVVSMDRDYLRGQARQLLTDDASLRKIVGVIHHPTELLKTLAELGEQGTRLGIFARELDASGITHDNILKSAVKSREATTDFNVYGTALEPVARLIPFFNPGIQSVSRFNIVTGRAIADIAKSVQALTKGELRSPDYAARYASRVLTYVVAPAAALHFLRVYSGRQDEYLELPAWRRHLFSNIPLPPFMAKTRGFGWASVPKAFELGVLYGTGTEVMLEWMEKHDKKALDEYRDSLRGAFMPNVMPALLLGSVENLANRKIAFDRPIMPESQKTLDARLQYGLYTSDTAKLGAAAIRSLPSLVGQPVSFALKLTGDQAGINAYDVDNEIRSLTAGLGQYYVTPALDYVIRKMIGGTKMAERIGIDDKGAPYEVPVVRAFVPRPSEKGAGLVERTYQDIAAAEKAWNTYLALEGWQKDEYLQDPEKRRLIVGHQIYSDVREGLSTLNKLRAGARKFGDEDYVAHLTILAADMARSVPQRINEAMSDPTAMNAIAIARELSKMRSEGRARHAEAATVLEGMIENDVKEDEIRGYVQTMAGEDRQWATRYLRELRNAKKLNAEREAAKGASRREKLRLKQEGLLPR